MVRPKRFELLAYRFVACCSIQLSYERMRSLLVETPFSVKKKDAQGNDVFLKKWALYDSPTGANLFRKRGNSVFPCCLR